MAIRQCDESLARSGITLISGHAGTQPKYLATVIIVADRQTSSNEEVEELDGESVRRVLSAPSAPRIGGSMHGEHGEGRREGKSDGATEQRDRETRESMVTCSLRCYDVGTDE
jgi:hypothetical protein